MSTLPANHTLWNEHGLDPDGIPIKKVSNPTENKYKIISAGKTDTINGDLHYIYTHEDTGEFAYKYSSTIKDFKELNDALRTHHHKKVKVCIHSVRRPSDIPHEHGNM